MYWYDIQQHKQPHFHARYGGREAVFNFTGDRLSGSIGSRAERLVREWTQERELHQAWTAAMQGKEIPWITPIQ